MRGYIGRAVRASRSAALSRRCPGRITLLPHVTGLVGLRPRPGAAALRERALQHDAADQLPPRAVEHAILVGRGQRDVALPVVLGPHAGLAVVRELTGDRGLAVAVLGVLAAGLAVLVARLGRELAVDVLAHDAVELAALPGLLQRRHTVGGPLLPRAVAEVIAIVSLDHDLAAVGQL